MNAPESLWVDVTVESAGDRGGALEYGLQDRSGALDPGTPVEGGAVRYLTEVGVRHEPEGARYSGPAVHGPSRERFLYVSFRLPGAGTEWSRRVKILLPSQVDPEARGLRARVRDQGKPRAQLLDGGWSFAHESRP